jgi:hypothetical protein
VDSYSLVFLNPITCTSAIFLFIFLQVTFLLILKYSVIAISATRIWLVWINDINADGSWYYDSMLTVECSEITGVLVALSVPALKPLFDIWLARLGIISVASHRGSSYSRSGGLGVGAVGGPSFKSRSRFASNSSGGGGGGGGGIGGGRQSSRSGDGGEDDNDDTAIILVKPSHAHHRTSRDKPLPAVPGYFTGITTRGSSEDDLLTRAETFAVAGGKNQVNVNVRRSGSIGDHDEDIEAASGIRVTKDVSVVSTRDVTRTEQ